MRGLTEIKRVNAPLDTGDIQVVGGVLSTDVITLLQGNDKITVPVVHIEHLCRSMWEVFRAQQN